MTKPQDTVKVKKWIMEMLECRTSKNPLCRGYLVSGIRDRGVEIQDRDLRLLVAEMVIDDGYPVGTTTKGYFIVTNREDMIEADRELEAKAKSISVRRNALWRNFQACVRGVEQLEIPAIEGMK